MSETYIAADLRRLVIARANGLCEYCLIHEDDTLFGCHIDHVIGEKHGGPTVAENLAYACAACNRRKGSDVGSISATGEFCRFSNPRLDRWPEHFRLAGLAIEPLTIVGEVTCRILGFNDADRLFERQALSNTGRYPGQAARARMGPAT